MDAGILIIFLCSFIIMFCFICLCCSVFSDSEDEYRGKNQNWVPFNRTYEEIKKFSDRSDIRAQNAEEAYVIQLEEIKKPETVPINSPSKSVKSPTKSVKSPSKSNEEIPPPSYEEWLFHSGQITPDF